MKGDFTGDLRRRMEEECLLPTDAVDDPATRQLLDEIAAAGDWAAREWAELHRENERLRVMLRDVLPPEGLESRLFAIPTTSRMRRHALRRPLGLAAAILLLLTVGAVVMKWQGARTRTDSTIAHVVALVAHDHELRPTLVVETSDPVEAARALETKAPFDVRLVGAPIGAELVGARVCSFPEGPLVYSRWRDVGGQDDELSLYQIRISDFDLPPDLPPQEFRSSEADGGCRIRLWSDNRFAYAVVHDASHAQK
ncbi:MAG: hypothetical protein L0219_05535 [Phycisphaerales bacterium]|nr:hypothetical protein [Phycisphaerales bacterium]